MDVHATRQRVVLGVSMGLGAIALAAFVLAVVIGAFLLVLIYLGPESFIGR